MATSSSGPGGSSSIARDEARFGAAEPAPLPLLQHRARLDEVETQRPGEPRHAGSGAQEVAHQRAAAGAELGEDHRIGLPRALPEIGAPQPDQFAEDLADLGRGDEIAGGAERIMPGVIAGLGVVQRHRHERGDRERPLAADPPGDRRDQVGHRAPPPCHREAAASGGCRRAQTTSATPASRSGIDSSWPIVVPNTRKPSCASGWRNSSPDIRATA